MKTKLKSIKVKSIYVKPIINGSGARAKSIDNYVSTAKLVDEIDIFNPNYVLQTKMFVLQMDYPTTRFYGVRFTRKPDGEIILAESDGMVTLIPLEEVKTYKLAK